MFLKFSIQFSSTFCSAPRKYTALFSISHFSIICFIISIPAIFSATGFFKILDARTVPTPSGIIMECLLVKYLNNTGFSRPLYSTSGLPDIIFTFSNFSI